MVRRFAVGSFAAFWLTFSTFETPAAPNNGFTPLFNGKDLTNFYTWLGAPHGSKESLGKNNDPDKVFSVVDGQLVISGKVFGALTTEKEYENYHLRVEFKWGDKTWRPREKAARDSGILLHCVGPDGATKNGFWMESIECQIMEGCTGDFILVAGGSDPPSLTCEVEYRPTWTPNGEMVDHPYFKPGGKATTFTKGRINWLHRDPKWKNELGFRGEKDVEKPVGQWNVVECICDGDKITNIVNGTVVNVGTKASLTKGKIQFQSEGAEIIFRTIEIKPLAK
jgi:hypothetical protein